MSGLNISVRKSKSSDTDAIASLFNEVIEQGNAFLWQNPLSVEQISEIMGKQSATYIAEVNSKIAGVYMIHPNYPDRGSHIANATYAIHKDFQGRGIGRLLGKHSIKFAKDYGFKAIQFNAVVSTNKAAVNLWKSLRFQIIGTVPKGFKTREDEYVDTYIFHRFI